MSHSDAGVCDVAYAEYVPPPKHKFTNAKFISTIFWEHQSAHILI